MSGEIVMTFFELAQQRYSVRKFSPKPVEDDKLEQVLQAGRVAPTAKNLQPQLILVATSPEALEKAGRCSPCTFGAPAVLIVCFDQNIGWVRTKDNKNHSEIDATIVAAHMMLQAQELGLGTTWVGVFDPEAVRREFSLPDNIVPSCFLPIGYPAADAAPSPFHASRKALSETVKYC
jgi:nitroreductase